MATKTFWAETYLGNNTAWPGTYDNPMRPLLVEHPQTGEEIQVHYNDRNLRNDRDYKDAVFTYISGRGWCYPISVEVPESQTSLNGIKL